MSDERRSIELEIEVPGTPEQVWRAIATGPGISSWYVPHTVEECQGGAASASFGPGPEMQIPGRVVAWEPPHRIVFDGGEDVGGLAFEWLVEARDGGSCVVRLVNSGFGSGEEWDAQYDGMTEGWRLFLDNLRLHLQHFSGETATPMLPMGIWAGSPADSWTRLTGALGVPAAPAVGERITITTPSGIAMAATVVEAGPRRLALLLTEPVRGTGIVAAEAHGDQAGVSVWFYLYGAEGAAAAGRDAPAWQQWLTEHAPAAG